MDRLEQHVNITIRHLHEQVSQIKKLQKQFSNLIDPELGKYVSVANLKNQTLILIADNASVATHIKLMTPELIRLLNETASAFAITAIKCKIKKSIEPPKAPKLQTNSISKESARAIAQAAESIRNPKLQAALKKLGS